MKKPKSKKELLSLTHLPERTLRYKLNKLKQMGLIKELYSFKDMRMKFFVVKSWNGIKE